MRALYPPASSMLSQMLKQDIHANNLANVDTVGFKRCLADVISRTDIPDTNVTATHVDSSPGDIRITGNPLHLALEGDGYFVIQTPAGRRYTRDGRFSLNSQRQLVNRSGHLVLGRNGPIQIGGATPQIAADGTVYTDDRRIDSLLVVQFPPDAELQNASGAAFTTNAPPQPIDRPSIEDGALEGSNVQAVSELGAMRVGLRIFEANVNAVTTLGETWSTLIQAATA